MDARFMQMHNFVLTREIIINSSFPVDRMRELNFHRETAVILRLTSSVINNTYFFDFSDLKFEYDAFVIFSSQDSDWVVNTLIPTLEKKHGLKCCIHYRNFTPGVLFRDNVVDSVYKCRKTLAIVSTHFFDSNYCGSELDFALHRLMEKRDDSLVVIKLDKVDKRKLPMELQERSYIDYSKSVEKEAWEKKLVDCLKNKVNK